jgi:hypothetical protein
MQVDLIFHLQQTTLPSHEEHLRYLWKVAKVLEQFGFPIENWYPSASTQKKSLANPAFDRNGPTPVAVGMLRVKDTRVALHNYRITSVWNGVSKGRACAFSVSLSTDAALPRCVLHLGLYEVDELDYPINMKRFIFGLIDIWPAACEATVGPLMYYTMHQVFPRRPGAGWMLYLPCPITANELPEAAELVPVTHGDKQLGTLIVSVADRVFSVDEPEHIKIANSIEVRLADQDILPR